MSAVDEILQQLPIEELAQQVDADPAEVKKAASQALPALLGGLEANAQNPEGSASLLGALGQHKNALLSDGNVDLSKVDQQDGEKIAANIFGDKQEQVYAALGGVSGGGGDSLTRKLIPMLAPIVLSYVASQVFGNRGGPVATPQQSPASGGGLGSVLQDVLGGALGGGSTQSQPAPQQSQSAGGILDMLGGLLGGGRR